MILGNSTPRFHQLSSIRINGMSHMPLRNGQQCFLAVWPVPNFRMRDPADGNFQFGKTAEKPHFRPKRRELRSSLRKQVTAKVKIGSDINGRFAGFPGNEVISVVIALLCKMTAQHLEGELFFLLDDCSLLALVIQIAADRNFRDHFETFDSLGEFPFECRVPQESKIFAPLVEHANKRSNPPGNLVPDTSCLAVNMRLDELRQSHSKRRE